MLDKDFSNEELALLAKDNNCEALNLLISKNEGLVVYMSSRFLTMHGFNDYKSTGLDEDYKQICRISISKAVRNYNASSGVKFATYAGKIMYHDMIREFTNDSEYRIFFTDTLLEDDDCSAEECDEEYGDAYDNRFERRRDDIFDTRLPSSVFLSSSKVTVDSESDEQDAFEGRMLTYAFMLDTIMKPAQESVSEPAEEKPAKNKDTAKKKKYIGVYDQEKETELSWKYPIYHKALHNLQLQTVRKDIDSPSFLEAHRMILDYRYGLTDLEPHTLKETAEHFNVTPAYIKEQEKAALLRLKVILMIKKLI